MFGSHEVDGVDCVPGCGLVLAALVGVEGIEELLTDGADLNLAFLTGEENAGVHGQPFHG